MSFELILEDSRVKAFFAKISKSLALCDMIAKGIVLAYNGLAVEAPAVIRLRGSKEGIGQMMASQSQFESYASVKMPQIADSSLSLHASGIFDEAAGKVIEISKSR